jgi:hypothetical protein
MMVELPRAGLACVASSTQIIALIVTSDINQNVAEGQTAGARRRWGRIGFLLALPTVFGWGLLFLPSWTSVLSPVSSVLLAIGCLIGPLGFLMCLYAFAQRRGRRWVSALGLLFHGIGCAGLCAVIFVGIGRLGSESHKPWIDFTNSKETTYITEPLRPDGYPDYLAALNDRYGKEVTVENNAVVLLWRAIGLRSGSKSDRINVSPEYFRLLGMESLPDKGEYYVEWGDYVAEVLSKEFPTDGWPVDKVTSDRQFDREQQLNEQWRKACVAPWSAASFPVIADWLKKNRKPLDMVVAASKRPRFFSPLRCHGELPVLSSNDTYCYDFRRAADGLCVRAMLELNDGKASDAREDLLACCRLSDLLAQHPSMSYWLNAKTLRDHARSGLLALFHYGPRDIEAARALDRRIQQMPDLPDLAGVFDVHGRCQCFDAIASWLRDVERGRNPLEKLMLHAVVDPVLNDWDEAFRVGNAWYDTLNNAAREPKWSERMEAARQIDKELLAMSERNKSTLRLNVEFLKSPRRAMGHVVGEKVLCLLAPALPLLLRIEDEATTQGQLLRIASAINVYRAEHGAYPKQLTELTPNYLTTLPVDIFHGATMQYRLQGDGYILYSVGPNGWDDGGFNQWDRPDSDKGRDCDDVAITMPPKPER